MKPTYLSIFQRFLRRELHKALQLSMLLITVIAGLLLPQQGAVVHAQSEQITIRLVIEQLVNIHNTENWPDTGTADYYAASVTVAGRSFGNTDRIWDQDRPTPFWQWVNTVALDDLPSDAEGGHRSSVNFELWDDDFFDDTAINIFNADGRGLEAFFTFDESGCVVTTIANSEVALTASHGGFARDTWHYGLCRLDLVSQGHVGDRAAVTLSIQLSRTPTDSLIPLYNWWSSQNADNGAGTIFSSTISPGTASPAPIGEWAGELGDLRAPSYGLFRVEALVVNPNSPLESGMTPLYHWFSPSRGDHFTTTNPLWAGAPGDPARAPDYQPLGIIGYLFTEPGPDRVPLHSWYDPDREDNFITSQDAWHGSPGETRGPNYGYVRLEGYGLRAEEGVAPMARFEGSFHGMLSGDVGSTADVTIEFTSSDTGVTAQLDLGPGLVFNGGCVIGTRSIPPQHFVTNGAIDPANPFHLSTAVPVSVSGVTIDIIVNLDLSATGEVITASVTFDLPIGLEFLGCHDRSLTLTLTREA